MNEYTDTSRNNNESAANRVNSFSTNSISLNSDGNPLSDAPSSNQSLFLTYQNLHAPTPVPNISNSQAQSQLKPAKISSNFETPQESTADENSTAILQPLTEIITGEEEEDNLIQKIGTLFKFDSNKTWSKRGLCCFKLNQGKSNNQLYTRMIVRCKTSKKCFVNSYVWKNMHVSLRDEQTVIFGAVNFESKNIEVYAFKASKVIARQLYRMLKEYTMSDTKNIESSTMDNVNYLEPKQSTEIASMKNRYDYNYSNSINILSSNNVCNRFFDSSNFKAENKRENSNSECIDYTRGTNILFDSSNNNINFSNHDLCFKRCNESPHPHHTENINKTSYMSYPNQNVSFYGLSGDTYMDGKKEHFSTQLSENDHGFGDLDCKQSNFSEDRVVSQPKNLISNFQNFFSNFDKYLCDWESVHSVLLANQDSNKNSLLDHGYILKSSAQTVEESVFGKRQLDLNSISEKDFSKNMHLGTDIDLNFNTDANYDEDCSSNDSVIEDKTNEIDVNHGDMLKMSDTSFDYSIVKDCFRIPCSEETLALKLFQDMSGDFYEKNTDFARALENKKYVSDYEKKICVVNSFDENDKINSFKDDYFCNYYDQNSIVIDSIDEKTYKNDYDKLPSSVDLKEQNFYVNYHVQNTQSLCLFDNHQCKDDNEKFSLVDSKEQSLYVDYHVQNTQPLSFFDNHQSKDENEQLSFVESINHNNYASQPKKLLDSVVSSNRNFYTDDPKKSIISVSSVNNNFKFDDILEKTYFGKRLSSDTKSDDESTFLPFRKTKIFKFNEDGNNQIFYNDPKGVIDSGCVGGGFIRNLREKSDQSETFKGGNNLFECIENCFPYINKCVPEEKYPFSTIFTSHFTKSLNSLADSRPLDVDRQYLVHKDEANFFQKSKNFSNNLPEDLNKFRTDLNKLNDKTILKEQVLSTNVQTSDMGDSSLNKFNRNNSSESMFMSVGRKRINPEQDIEAKLIATEIEANFNPGEEKSYSKSNPLTTASGERFKLSRRNTSTIKNYAQAFSSKINNVTIEKSNEKFAINHEQKRNSDASSQNVMEKISLGEVSAVPCKEIKDNLSEDIKLKDVRFQKTIAFQRDVGAAPKENKNCSALDGDVGSRLKEIGEGVTLDRSTLETPKEIGGSVTLNKFTPETPKENRNRSALVSNLAIQNNFGCSKIFAVTPSKTKDSFTAEDFKVPSSVIGSDLNNSSYSINHFSCVDRESDIIDSNQDHPVSKNVYEKLSFKTNDSIDKIDHKIVAEQNDAMLDKLEKIISNEAKEKLIRNRISTSGVNVDEEKLVSDCLSGICSLSSVMALIRIERNKMSNERLKKKYGRVVT